MLGLEERGMVRGEGVEGSGPTRGGEAPEEEPRPPAEGPHGWGPWGGGNRSTVIEGVIQYISLMESICNSYGVPQKGNAMYTNLQSWGIV